jgi:threonylcarbamoyladenosine tRNA methylthiotransferase MtaB
MPLRRRFFLRTLGCKANQYESQAMREALIAAGFAEAADPGGAEIFILNSCAVTGRAGASGRRAVRQAVRMNPALRVAIAGCGVDLGESWPVGGAGPPLLVANAGKPALAARLRAWLGETPAEGDAGEAPLAVSRFAGRSRALLKIQDGCGDFCSYCAVPLARGAPRSRPPEEITREAARLTAAGFRELALTGINIGAYRHGALDFVGLIRLLIRTPGLVRLRLGSLEPQSVDERLARAIGESAGRVCPHLHLPLQSGDDRVLAAMNRRYRAEEFLDKIRMLRDHVELPAIGADLMVGFPGESGAAFARSLEICRRAGFSRLHVFPFSPRPGTPAAAWRRDFPERVAEERKSRLLEAGREMAAAFAVRCLGRRERVILENGDGLSDRYLRVRLDHRRKPPGEVVYARITGTAGGELLGEAVPPA